LQYAKRLLQSRRRTQALTVPELETLFHADGVEPLMSGHEGSKVGIPAQGIWCERCCS